MISKPALCESHEALADRVHAAIQASPFVSRRGLRFETHRGCVTLRGEVASYFQKQMAQEAVRGLHGVEAIENELEVQCF
jgi:osmotically-inducible protein OsmY